MFALFEDRLAGPDEPAGWLFADLLSVTDGDWGYCAEVIKAARQSGHWVVTALPYEMGGDFEPALRGPSAAARCWVFAQRQVLSHAEAHSFLQKKIAGLPETAKTAGVGGIRAAWGVSEYQQAVERIQAYIRAGDCYQVNLTFPLRFDYYGDPLALYVGLRKQQATRYGGVILDPDQPILSLSPELFVEKQGETLRVRPMKGTAARQSEALADSQAAENLAASAKNRAENLMIVDLLRNDLGKLAVTGSVQVQQLFQVEAYPSVWQMVSEVTAQVPDQFPPEELLPALFPCGSITGAPKVRAMQIIQEIESELRGVYTGALGWFAPNGDCRLNVAIRTLSLQPTGENRGVGTMGIGSGIVQDSCAEDEWQECWLKARFLTDLPSDLGLIETLRLDVSAGQSGQFPLLSAHLQRLAKSAKWFGFTYDEHQLRKRLQLVADSQMPGLWRVRVLLKQSADPEISVLPLLPEPAGPRHVMVSPVELDGRHPLRRHKTTWRSEYDQALSDMAHDTACFDVLFFNHQGVLMEGARSTVLALIDDQWCTPPIESGALPGVWRGEVLAGRVAGFANVRIADISRADLQRATRLVCGNALRGGIFVTCDLSEWL